MNNQILMALKRKLEDLSAFGKINPDKLLNTLKEELHFYVLNFIYSHPEYNKWIMYGGSALRICHRLDRMSVDLDFEIDHPLTEIFLEELKEKIELYFTDTYGIASEFLIIKIGKKGLVLKFNIGEELDLELNSKQVHIKIDLNNFIPTKIVTENISIKHDQFSFNIRTYNMSSLMASKITAIFLRGERGFNENRYDYKGRDIYDLLWYMDKKVIPDLDYLGAKGVSIKDPKELFNRLSIDLLNYEKMDSLLKDDLTALFLRQEEIENWLKNWRNIYLRLLDEYKIRTISNLVKIIISEDFHSDNFFFTYYYETEEGVTVRIVYTMSDYWMEFGDGNIPIKINDEIVALVKGEFENSTTDKLKKYTMLFYEKTEAYFKKTKKIMFGDSITTKVIRITADNLNYKEQIVLTKNALLSCELDDLLK